MNVRSLKLMGDLGQIIPVPFDIRDQDSVDKAVSKSNVVINCIGNNFETRNFTYRQTYVDTTKAILEVIIFCYKLQHFDPESQASKKAGVKRIINLSSVNASLQSESTWLQANVRLHSLICQT